MMTALGFCVGRAADNGARASKPEVRKEVITVIEAQLAAFRAHDGKQAYTWASSALRAQTPRRQFELIVQHNYPEIWANTRAEFGLVRDDGVRAKVVVQVFSREGSSGYDYGLVKEREGWRIESVLRHTPKKSDKL
jgi:hypothetical protein